MDGGRSTAADSEPESDDYTVLVAAANPNHVEQLLRTATDLARHHDGRVEVVSVIHKHSTSPFLLFSEERIKAQFAGDRRAILDRALEHGDRTGVPVSGRLLVGRSVASELVRAAAESDADLLLLGWQGSTRPSDVVLGTTIDPVLRRAPCDTLVERVGPMAETVESVLLPTRGGPHIELAAQVALAIATANDASIRIVAPAETEETAIARDRIDAAAAWLGDAPAVEGVVREAETPAEAILAEPETYDLIVMGASEGGLSRDRVGSVQQSVGRRADCPVIMAQRRRDRSSLRRVLERWRR